MRPYPEGIGFDEAWFQRQRADAAEAALPRWISATHLLPEPYTVVVGLIKALGEWVEITTAWHKDRWLDDLEVEYWMPLPELPPFRDTKVA